MVCIELPIEMVCCTPGPTSIGPVPSPPAPAPAGFGCRCPQLPPPLPQHLCNTRAGQGQVCCVWSAWMLVLNHEWTRAACIAHSTGPPCRDCIQLGRCSSPFPRISAVHVLPMVACDALPAPLP